MTKPLVFVSGGTGLVGSHLLYDLSRDGYRVRALKRSTSDILRVFRLFESYNKDDADRLFRQIEWMDIDLFDFDAIVDALDGCDAVYHATAVVSFCNSDKTRIMKVNVEGTAVMVNACLEKQVPLCFVSSIGALGRGRPGEPLTENDLWQSSEGRSVYAYSKHKSETEVWRGIAEGLQATIVNPSVILGPGDWTKGSLTFFSRVYKGLRFYTPGMTGFVDVRDVSRCMIQLMERKCFGERYILSAGDLSYRELFHMIADGLNVKKPSVEAKSWMVSAASRLSGFAGILTGKSPALTKETACSAFQQHRYSNTKIMKALEYEFIPLKKCIEDSCAYFLRTHSFADAK